MKIIVTSETDYNSLKQTHTEYVLINPGINPGYKLKK